MGRSLLDLLGQLGASSAVQPQSNDWSVSPKPL